MNIIKIGKEFINANELFKLHHQGATFVCGLCNTNLISAFTREDAFKQGIAPGLFCPNNINHVNIHFNLRRN